MEQTNKEQMLEDILKEFSAQGELVKALGDALMHIALAGHFDEQGQWQDPEWKKAVLFDVAPHGEGMTTRQDASRCNLLKFASITQLFCVTGHSNMGVRAPQKKHHTDTLVRKSSFTYLNKFQPSAGTC